MMSVDCSLRQEPSMDRSKRGTQDYRQGARRSATDVAYRAAVEANLASLAYDLKEIDKRLVALETWSKLQHDLIGKLVDMSEIEVTVHLAPEE